MGMSKSLIMLVTVARVIAMAENTSCLAFIFFFPPKMAQPASSRTIRRSTRPVYPAAVRLYVVSPYSST